ncbi:hypothetical protein [Pseudomonas sp.]|uniref:hypothetical protein n=1 Tax=Pseudomonas sp. TaxID=306 RepID=UPI003F2E75F9
MTRKHCRRTHRREAAPTLVAYYLNPEVSTQERMAVEAIRAGWAVVCHFDVLADCRDMLALGAELKDDQPTLAVCELGLVALLNIKDRYRFCQRIGASGNELQALYALVDVAEDFWKRQPGSLFIDAEAALSKARAEQRERRAA